MKARIVVLALCMLFFGTINTISTKYQDLYVVGHSQDEHKTPITFKHPAVQSACMFFGEALCLIPFFFFKWRRGKLFKKTPTDPSASRGSEEQARTRRIRRVLVFAIPAMCDACASTMLNLGLYYTDASIFQMLRGTMVLFAGMFTVTILRRRLFNHHWFGMVLITAGAAIVGASSIMQSSSPQPLPKSLHELMETLADNSTAGSEQVGRRMLLGITDTARLAFVPPGKGSGTSSVVSARLFGNILVVLAQAFAALQFILEEKFLVHYRVPALMAVGVEGCWGLLLCAIVLPILTVVRGSDGLPLDDAPQAFQQMFSSWPLAIAVLGSIFSIACFNFFGISVTKSLSGAARATIDASRTLFIWLVSLQVGWEQFHPLEVVGFIVLISGTSVYNEILRTCLPGGAQPPVSPGRSAQTRRRSRSREPLGRDGSGDASGPGVGGNSMTEPLLGPSSGQEREPEVTADVSPRQIHNIPIMQQPAPQMPAGSMAGSMAGSDIYTMARSMRLGANALSPHSLDSDGLMSDPGNSFTSGALSATPQNRNLAYPDRGQPRGPGPVMTRPAPIQRSQLPGDLGPQPQFGFEAVAGPASDMPHAQPPRRVSGSLSKALGRGG